MVSWKAYFSVKKRGCLLLLYLRGVSFPSLSEGDVFSFISLYRRKWDLLLLFRNRKPHVCFAFHWMVSLKAYISVERGMSSPSSSEGDVFSFFIHLLIWMKRRSFFFKFFFYRTTLNRFNFPTEEFLMSSSIEEEQVFSFRWRTQARLSLWREGELLIQTNASCWYFY